jgi:uncharacterized protein
MRQTYGRWRLMLVAAVVLAVSAVPAAAQDSAWAAELTTWRTQHASDLQKPDGWLSLAGLEWLAAGDNSFGSAPENKIHLGPGSPAHLGVLRLENNVVQLLPPSGADFPQELLVAGQPARPQVVFGSSGDDQSALHLTIGTLNMYVIRRAERFALRIKDSKSAGLLGFHGLRWFAPDAGYRVTAKWIPYSPPKTVTLATLVGTSYDAPVPGAAEFTLDGQSFRVEAVLEDPQAPKLFFILRDATSTSSTYPACRFLYTGLPDHGLGAAGTLVLDFNRMENPPCAYTPYATCPLPPAGNRLGIALPVGEKRYHE